MSYLNRDAENRSERLPIPAQKHLALVAHDSRKADLLDWVDFNRNQLNMHKLYGTGTTGGLIADKLNMDIHRFKSGPLGGDQQIGGAIADGLINTMIFFWDPLEPQSHDVDVKALQRIAVLYNIPIATNRTTADFLISSNLFNDPYERFMVDYGKRLAKMMEGYISNPSEMTKDQ